MRRLIRRLRILGRRRFARSWRRSGGLWGRDWSPFCRGHGWRRRLPAFRKVRGRMGHPHLLVLSSQFTVLRSPARRHPLLALRVDWRGRSSLQPMRFRGLWTSCKPRLRGKHRTASTYLNSPWIRSSRIRTRRGRISTGLPWQSWRLRSRRRGYCSRSWFGLGRFGQGRICSGRMGKAGSDRQ